jgi:hypothetical protein
MGGRLLVKPVRTEANEGLSMFMDDPGTLFPLRFTDASSAEIVNGALSGFFGCRFGFEPGLNGIELLLTDHLGTTTYRRLP